MEEQKPAITSSGIIGAVVALVGLLTQTDAETITALTENLDKMLAAGAIVGGILTSVWGRLTAKKQIGGVFSVKKTEPEAE